MFERLSEELDRWEGQGISPSFWWRDDDLQKPSRQLERLLTISARYQAPLALASVPKGIDSALAEKLVGADQISVLLHGFSHENHAPASERKMELGCHRPCAQIDAEIRKGLDDFQALFGAQFVPVLVPPWNRIDPEILHCLRGSGICGLSTLGARKAADPAPGIHQVNVHLDILNWREGRKFAGEERCIDQLLQHLVAKRTGQADPDEATGIMSHHLVHDEGCWQFLEKLFRFLSERPAVQLVDVRALFTAATGE